MISNIMGNTPSQEQPVEKTYDSYISEQQRIISAQQEQIRNLSRMNLRQNILNSQQQVPQNILFQQQSQSDPYQQQYSQQQQQQHHQQQIPYNNQQQQLPYYNQQEQKTQKQKLDPYKILGISKNFDETSLKKAYLKKAMKTHPDRGGTPEAFQQVSIAYTVLLKKIKDMKNNHSHHELRDNAKQYMGEQQGIRNVNLSDNFDQDVFNKIYEENKIKDVYDEGYGSWMNRNQLSDNEPKRMFSGEFNKNMFNNEFEKYKAEQSQKMGTQMVKYNEPQVDISYKGKSQIMSLGQGKVEDFSGESGNGLAFRDYKDAFTNSCLIHTSNVNIRKRAKNINDVEQQRSNLSYQVTPSEYQRQQLQKAQKDQEEQQRLLRLQSNDQRAFGAYDQIHRRMLGR
jgi:curved DNA-binding protein CbpA